MAQHSPKQKPGLSVGPLFEYRPAPKRPNASGGGEGRQFLRLADLDLQCRDHADRAVLPFIWSKNGMARGAGE
jgi:hypothetical protein